MYTERCRKVVEEMLLLVLMSQKQRNEGRKTGFLIVDQEKKVMLCYGKMGKYRGWMSGDVLVLLCGGREGGDGGDILHFQTST